MQKSDRIWAVAALLMMALLAWMALESHVQEWAKFPHGEMQIRHADGSHEVYGVEVATTPEQQERGLMFRKVVPANTGMIFIWAEDQPVSMWMKNTVVPLDMLFVEHGGRIEKIIANAVPYDLTPLSSDEPVQAVVEIAGGEAARQNIKVGDVVLYPGLREKKK